jgi:hypothetical protein
MRTVYAYWVIKPNPEQSEDGKSRLRAEMLICRLQALRRVGTDPSGIAVLPRQEEF